MKEQSNYSQFYKVLLENSVYSQFKEQVLSQWEHIHSVFENNYCICGMPIKENCIIENSLNGKTLIVGNVCVKKFLLIDKDFIFRGISSIKNNRIPNKEFINYCYEKNYIYENQKDFLLNKYRKRKLTIKQEEFKNKILFKLRLRRIY